MRRARVHAEQSADPVAIEPGRRRETIASGPMRTAIDSAPQEFVQRRVSDLGDRMVKLLPRLRQFAASLTHDQTLSEDLVQDAYVRAFEHLDQWRPGSRLDSWMYRITQNLWIDQLRTKKARGEIVNIAAVGELSDCDGRSVAETRFAIRELTKRIKRLPSDQQTLIRLVYVDGFSYQEAAKAVDSPTGTVMSRLARARTALNDAERIEEINNLPDAMGSHEFQNGHTNCRRSRR